MKHSYFLSPDNFLYRHSSKGNTEFFMPTINNWWISGYFLHIDIRNDKTYRPITRDTARKKFPYAFKARR